MATFQNFPEANAEWKGYPETEHNPEVGDLPVHRVQEDGQMHGASISCWKLEPEELEYVKETGVIWLYVLGDVHPAVLIMGKSPFIPEIDEGTPTQGA